MPKEKNLLKEAQKYIEMKLGTFTLWKLKREILAYYKTVDPQKIDKETVTALEYLKSHRMSIFPYPFFSKYKFTDVEVFTDEESGLHYVMHNGYRMYFRRGTKKRRVQRQYSFLCAEQDPASAHCYLSDNFDVTSDDILFDIGAAEGNLSLSLIDKVGKIFLFEYDKEWTEVLRKTFEPWKDKVTIIEKYVSDTNTETTITIDTVLKDLNPKSVFLKLDVEGMERQVIKGAENTLKAENMTVKAAVCTYHNQNDYVELSGIMKSKGYSIETSSGYMLFVMEKLLPPYFRRGLIRCKK